MRLHRITFLFKNIRFSADLQTPLMTMAAAAPATEAACSYHAPLTHSNPLLRMLLNRKSSHQQLEQPTPAVIEGSPHIFSWDELIQFVLDNNKLPKMEKLEKLISWPILCRGGTHHYSIGDCKRWVVREFCTRIKYPLHDETKFLATLLKLTTATVTNMLSKMRETLKPDEYTYEERQFSGKSRKCKRCSRQFKNVGSFAKHRHLKCYSREYRNRATATKVQILNELKSWSNFSAQLNSSSMLVVNDVPVSSLTSAFPSQQEPNRKEDGAGTFQCEYQGDCQPAKSGYYILRS